MSYFRRGPNLQNIPIRSSLDGGTRRRIRELFERIVRPTPLEQFVSGLQDPEPEPDPYQELEERILKEMRARVSAEQANKEEE